MARRQAIRSCNSYARTKTTQRRQNQQELMAMEVD